MYNFLKKSLFYITFLLLSYILVIDVFSINIKNTFFSLLLILVIIIIALKTRNLKIDYKKFFIIKNYGIFIFLLAFILRFISLFYFKIEPYVDFEVMIEAAKSFSKGVNPFISDNYFLRWAYQTPFVLYESLLYLLFKSVFFIKVINCFTTALICLLIYKIGKNIFSNKSAIIASFLYSINCYFLIFSGVLSNQHISTLFLLISIYLLLFDVSFIKNKYIKLILCGIFLALSNLMRPEGIVYLAIYFAYIFLSSLKYSKNIQKNILCFIKIFGIITISYLFINKSADFIITRTKINPNGTKNMDVLWKFVCASDYTSNGGYSNRGLYTLGNKDLELSFIKDNLKIGFKKHLILFNKKEIEFWKNTPYFWIIQNLNLYPKIVFISIKIIDKFIMLFTILFSFYSMLVNKKKTDKFNKIDFLYLAICANFFVYQLVEVQARYAYVAKIFLFLLAMDGLDKFNKKYKIVKKNN